MKIPPFIAAAAVTTILAVQAWTLIEIVNLKVQFASFSATVAAQKQLAQK